MRTAPFFRYFFSYIFRAKTRQKLLFIAVTGLFLSAFSLMVIQGIMGGLQHGLISRSKSINGFHVIKFPGAKTEQIHDLKDILRKEGIPFYSELETEVMIRRKNFVAPAKLHGIDLTDERPEFLKDKDFSGLVLGSDLASKLKTQFMDDIEVIAPGVTDSIMGEVPRFVSDTVSDYLYTEISEVDDTEMFARLTFVQNLLRERSVNQIRIFGEVSPALMQKLMETAPRDARAQSWADLNQALVWSLNLETRVMLFLFISMSLLVAIAITSGLMIFYSKIRRDLMSFWILGMGQKKLMQLSFKFTLILSGVTVLIGGIFGSLVLRVLENYGHDLMPDIFVERNLPVQLNFNSIVISLLIPFGISLVFSWFSFAYFRKENQSFVNIVRSLS
jgi:lipoprotein-releasing system permease protein